MSKVDLAKKTNPYCKKDSTEVDFQKLSVHVHKLHYKVQRNFDTHKEKTGKDHPLKSSTPLSIKAAAPGANGAGTGSDPLVDESEELWHGALTLGGQTIQLDFDTGSSDVSA